MAASVEARKQQRRWRGSARHEIGQRHRVVNPILERVGLNRMEIRIRANEVQESAKTTLKSEITNLQNCVSRFCLYVQKTCTRPEIQGFAAPVCLASQKAPKMHACPTQIAALVSEPDFVAPDNKHYVSSHRRNLQHGSRACTCSPSLEYFRHDYSCSSTIQDSFMQPFV